MLAKIIKPMLEAVTVLSTLEKTYIACCVTLVMADFLGGFTPDIFNIGFKVLIGMLVPILLIAKKTQKTVSAILSAILMVTIYTWGRGYLVG